ncbi:MAG: hypothetical protein IPM58_02945 [Nitrospira sp.]|nr:hypothetical protein [Nitrospira sp.]
MEREGSRERFYEWVDVETGVVLKLVSQNREWSFEYERIRMSPQSNRYFEEPRDIENAVAGPLKGVRSREVMNRFLRRAACLCCGLVWFISPMPDPAWSGMKPIFSRFTPLYDNMEFQKALEELNTLTNEEADTADVRRLKVRTLLRLGKPKDALTEYDRLIQLSKQDETPALRRSHLDSSSFSPEICESRCEGLPLRP